MNGLPIFVIAVRPSRYTYSFIEEMGDFTVNVPKRGMEHIVEGCGTYSGRDVDKFEKYKLTPIPSHKVKSPLIDECIIGYECRVIYKQDLIPENIKESVISNYYPLGDFHRLYFGEILQILADKDFAEKI